MNFIKSSTLLHAGRKISFLTVEKVNPTMIAASEFGGIEDTYILANETGFSDLARLFALARQLGQDEIIALKFDFQHMTLMSERFPSLINGRHKMLFISNFHTQIKIKDLLNAWNKKKIEQKKISLTIDLPNENDPENWEIKNSFTLKKQANCLFLSANDKILQEMASSCTWFCEETTEDGDHIHYDDEWSGNTAKSMGFTFYYLPVKDDNKNRSI